MKCCERSYVEVGVAVQRKVDRNRDNNPTSCGVDQRQESAAYVSTAIEVSQSKFIDDFFCKAPIAAQKNHGHKKRQKPV